MHKIILSALLIFSTPAYADVLINIDKTTQQMSIFVDGVQTYDWPVSTGKERYDTPAGAFVASSMNELWISKQWDNAPMPHSIFFTKEGHAIHATSEVDKLGNPASHGCVRLAPENAETLYDLVEANGLETTQVMISGAIYVAEQEQYTEPQEQYIVPYEEPPVYDEPGIHSGPDGFEFYGPGFQFQFKFDRKRERRERKRWRRR